MEILEVVRYRDEFYPSGFRKIFALMLVVAVTVLPEVFSWVGTPADQPSASRRSAAGFRPGGFLAEREPSRSGALQKLWAFAKRGLVVVAATFGVLLYYPERGFKRYALLCGPIIAMIVPLCVALYLKGRTEVYQEEILVVSLLALAPGIGLYILLTWRKAQRLGMDW